MWMSLWSPCVPEGDKDSWKSWPALRWSWDLPFESKWYAGVFWRISSTNHNSWEILLETWKANLLSFSIKSSKNVGKLTILAQLNRVAFIIYSGAMWHILKVLKKRSPPRFSECISSRHSSLVCKLFWVENNEGTSVWKVLAFSFVFTPNSERKKPQFPLDSNFPRGSLGD